MLVSRDIPSARVSAPVSPARDSDHRLYKDRSLEECSVGQPVPPEPGCSLKY